MKVCTVLKEGNKLLMKELIEFKDKTYIILSHQLKQRKRKGQLTLYLLDNKELDCGTDWK